MTDVVTRWTVTKAVRASDLPAPSRHIMLTLADVAMVGTAEIPARFTPSLKDLSKETGLDKSTVSRHLNLLEESGWIVRTRPDREAQLRGETTRYRLTVPPGRTPPLGAENDQDIEDALGAESDRGSRTERQDLGAQNDRGSRRERHKSRKSDLVRSTDQDPDLSSSDAAHRPDVEKVCEHLADRIQGNGANRPTITKRWRDSARLMLDVDKRDLDNVIKAIDWCQDDEFWRSNILSMPKLRERYEQLRLAAQRAAPRAPTRTAPVDLSAAMRRAQAREAAAQ